MHSPSGKSPIAANEFPVLLHRYENHSGQKKAGYPRRAHRERLSPLWQTPRERNHTARRQSPAHPCFTVMLDSRNLERTVNQFGISPSLSIAQNALPAPVSEPCSIPSPTATFISPHPSLREQAQAARDQV